MEALTPTRCKTAKIYRIDHTPADTKILILSDLLFQSQLRLEAFRDFTVARLLMMIIVEINHSLCSLMMCACVITGNHIQISRDLVSSQTQYKYPD